MKKLADYAVKILISVKGPSDMEGLIAKGFEHLTAKLLLGGLPVAVEMTGAEITVSGKTIKVSNVKLESTSEA